MNAILGMAERLSETNLDSEQRQYVEVLRSAGANLLFLIDGLLDLAKVESGCLQLESLDFNLESVVDQVIDLVAPQARAKGLVLLSRIQPGTRTELAGDPGRLTQILLNLLGNALKFTETGEVVLAVRNHVPGEPGRIDFAVLDTGVGIGEEKLESIFEALNPVDSITRKFRGTGLGLLLSARLLDHMGGRLSAASAPGKGSTFNFSVAFGLGVCAGPSIPHHPAELCGRRVLVISGNATQRLVLDEMLHSWGAETRSFSSPAEAFSTLSLMSADHRTISVAILDDSMPAADRATAPDLVQRGAPGVPILLLTSEPARASADEREPAVAAATLKPVKQSVLLHLLLDLLNGVALRSSPPPPHANAKPHQQIAADETDMPDELKELIPEYVRVVKQYAGEMASLLASHGFDRIRSMAHNIKGTGGSYGFPELTNLAAALESSAKVADGDAVTGHLSDLRDFLERLPVNG